MTSNPDTDVIVIGAGAIGLCCALELARSGRAVVVLERGLAPGAGCSSGSAGIVGASHVVPLASGESLRVGARSLLRSDGALSVGVRPSALPWLTRFVWAARPARYAQSEAALGDLAQESAGLHRRLDDELGTGYREKGFLAVHERRAGWDRARREAEHAGDVVLSGEEARRVCPQLGRVPLGAVRYPREAHCEPERFLRAVAGEAERLGADIVAGVEVRSIRPCGNGRSGAVLSTTAGDWTAREVVVAAGAWSPRLTVAIGTPLPLQGGKGYHVDLARRDGDPEMPIYLADPRIVVTPFRDRLRVTGMLQLTGTDMDVDRGRVDAIMTQAVRRLPALDGRKPVEVWRGLRPCTPDGMPAIGRARVARDVVIATGHGMWGLQLAPVTGRLVADLVAATDGAEQRLQPFDPNRFSVLRRAREHAAVSRP